MTSLTVFSWTPLRRSDLGSHPGSGELFGRVHDVWIEWDHVRAGELRVMTVPPFSRPIHLCVSLTDGVEGGGSGDLHIEAIPESRK